jgi:myosin heavy subunit
MSSSNTMDTGVGHVANMVEINNLTEESIRNNLQKRYEKDEIYVSN